ncbi:unnamed protein product [Urochloa humidicola]
MDSVVERGSEVCHCLVLPPNFSIYEQVPSHRHNLQRPSKSTWSATGAVTIAGRLVTHWHPQPVPAEVPFTGVTPTEPPGRILQGQLARRRRPRLERCEAHRSSDLVKRMCMLIEDGPIRVYARKICCIVQQFE